MKHVVLYSAVQRRALSVFGASGKVLSGGGPAGVRNGLHEVKNGQKDTRVTREG